MTPYFETAYSERTASTDNQGNLTNYSIQYFVHNVDNEVEACRLVQSKIEWKIENLSLRSVNYLDTVSEKCHKVEAIYGEVTWNNSQSTGPKGIRRSFDTTGGTLHLTQSLRTVAVYPAGAQSFNGAIGVDNAGNVNGVDIVYGAATLQEVHSLKPQRFTTAYQRCITRLTGTVNSNNFRGFKPGEVLFTGVQAEQPGDNLPWSLTFKFSLSMNVPNFTAAGIECGLKRGWDYAWVRYDEVKINEENSYTVANSVHLEQVYQYENFHELGIG